MAYPIEQVGMNIQRFKNEQECNRTSEKNMKELDKLNLKHRNLMRELVSGATYAVAGARTGFSHPTVARLMCSPLFKQEVEILRKEVDGRFAEDLAQQPVNHSSFSTTIEAEVMASLTTLIEIRDDDTVSAKVRQKSATELLDRAGYKAPEEKIERVVIEADEGLKAMVQHLFNEEAQENKEEKENNESTVGAV